MEFYSQSLVRIRCPQNGSLFKNQSQNYMYTIAERMEPSYLSLVETQAFWNNSETFRGIPRISGKFELHTFFS